MGPNDCLVLTSARSFKTTSLLITLAILLILTGAGMMLGCGTGGSGTKQQQSVPPSGLSYDNRGLAVMNSPISNDVPNVTGVVTSYTVSPALPAGLSISSSTGTISGTPTALTAGTSYNVSASNSAGSTSATIKISVAAPLQPPTALLYPQAAITTFVGVSITPDIPGGSGGAISSYTVSPALPPGLNLNSSTGVISGIPTAAAASTTYVVKGSNSAGRVTASVNPTITVNAALSVLLQLGNQYGISSLQFANSSILSEGGGLWTLWDYTSGAILASGNDGVPGQDFPGQAQMAGTTVAIGISGGVEVLSSADGHMLSTIASPGYGIELGTTSLLQDDSNWQLASDGSYIVYETQSGLYVYSPGGNLLCSQPGNYRNQGTWAIFAAPGQVQVANGPSGTNTVQVISVPSGGSTVSAAPYQGMFAGWFTDGGHFLTTQGGIVWTYSSSGVEQSSVQLAIPSGGLAEFPLPNLGGTGNWIWTFGYNSSSQFALNIYPIGSTTPALTDASADMAGFAVSGATLAVLPFYQTVSIIDLSGTTPVKTDYAVPPPINHAFAQEYPVVPFAAVSSTKWIAGIDGSGAGPMSGLILDGATLSGNTPRYIGNGAALSIAGSDNNVAIATGNGQISYFDPADATPLGSVALISNKVELSTDGSVLAASSQDYSLLNIYSLPSGTVSNSLTYSSQSAPGVLTDFTLSGSATTLGQIEDYQPNNQVNNYTLQVTPISGSPAIFSVTPQYPYGSILLSPDGTLAAVTTCTSNAVLECPGTGAVSIYQNGQPIAAVSGSAVGWIDNGRLLVNNYGLPGDAETPEYIGATIYSPTGTSLATPPLPALQSIQPVDSDTVYAPSKNVIY